jgi:hypothetical protein
MHYWQCLSNWSGGVNDKDPTGTSLWHNTLEVLVGFSIAQAGHAMS